MRTSDRPPHNLDRIHIPLPFTKAQALGNDFVILGSSSSLPSPLPSSLVRRLADRRYGVGCDQLIVLSPSSCAHARLEIWNADGTRAQACGNGSRCVIGFLSHERGLPPGTPLTLETASGIIRGHTTAPGEAVVEQGIPSFLSQTPLDLAKWGLPPGFAVSIGNPHLVIFVTTAEQMADGTAGEVQGEALVEELVEILGPCLEHHPFFPDRANVEFVEIAGSALRVRVWERGAGRTQACGSGACAAAFVAFHQGRVPGRQARVHLDGGSLEISWSPNQPILHRGPFQIVFQGVFLGD